MRIRDFDFNLRELAGSIGDFGTLIPLSIALIAINGLGFTPVFLMVGLFYLAAGLYFRLPIPVQPLKVVSAIAIASPEKITLEVMSATGIIFGVFLLLLAFTGLIDRIAQLFTKPIVRGIQLGLGFILITKGINFIKARELIIQDSGNEQLIGIVPVNIIIGIAAIVLVLVLLNNRRFPAALVIVAAGVVIGIAYGSLDNAEWNFGPTDMELFLPGLNDFTTALYLLVIPQIPLTIGNAIIGTTDTAKSLFGAGEATQRATNRGFSISMGLVNIPVGFLAGMPMCHGAGGLAAHYRFGARTGGANLMIGLVFMILALAFGMAGVSILSSIPNAVLGVLLLFAGLELAMLIGDIQNKEDLFIACLIAGIGLATTNMSIAFGAGIVVAYFIKRVRVEI
ncbi:MAG: putative sulfate/molybdate transporter [Chloroflexota bacterium]|nr:putative sulfate/molybdate transporter [Chloroflexota bacterium]